MEQWQDAASQQIKPLTDRLNELMSKGLGLLRSELGMDLGLKPELIPSWVILLAVCTALVLMVALWASACQAIFKTRPAVRPVDDGFRLKRAVVHDKLEEPKRKKKDTEKAPLQNGRGVTEPQEEPIISDEMVPYHQSTPQKSKKSKKKIKQAFKETKTVKADGKEPAEGTWETKVSNKEKREQRKKDKSSNDGSGSPGGGNTPVSTPPEQPKASALLSQKKKKVVTPGMTDVAVEVPAHIAAQKTDLWTSSKETTSLWRAEVDESWTVIERGITTAEGNRSLPGSSAGTDEPQPMMELLWLSQPQVEDEWSGLHSGSLDPTSDWNAPSEAWGNYEESTPEPPQTQEKPLPDPATVNLLVGVAHDAEDEKVEVETAADGADKVKKKKKKKKKSAEEEEGEEIEKMALAATVKKMPPLQENTAAVQPVRAGDVEFERLVKDNISKTQVPHGPSNDEPIAKRNSLSAPKQQKKPEEIQTAKPSKKKRARRET
ncbi:protein LYRIC-like [Tautogolabrus adspersus]